MLETTDTEAIQRHVPASLMPTSFPLSLDCPVRLFVLKNDTPYFRRLYFLAGTQLTSLSCKNMITLCLSLLLQPHTRASSPCLTWASSSCLPSHGPPVPSAHTFLIPQPHNYTLPASSASHTALLPLPHMLTSSPSLKVIFNLHQARVRPHLDYVVKLWCPNYRKNVDYHNSIQ